MQKHHKYIVSRAKSIEFSGPFVKFTFMGPFSSWNFFNFFYWAIFSPCLRPPSLLARRSFCPLLFFSTHWPIMAHSAWSGTLLWGRAANVTGHVPFLRLRRQEVPWPTVGRTDGIHAAGAARS